jgi:hypothetical protein
MTFTYDVTAVRHDGQRVPLATTVIYAANDIARNRSRDAAWSAVEVRETETGQIVAAYADGAAQGARHDQA